MFTLDLFVILFSIIQPSIFGLFLFLFIRSAIPGKLFFSSLKNAKKRYKGTRFFECATFPRLLGKVKYELHTLTFIVAFVVYDVDLLFFISGSILVDSWSMAEFLCFILFFFFFIIGLAYDITQQNFNWSY